MLFGVSEGIAHKLPFFKEYFAGVHQGGGSFRGGAGRHLLELGLARDLELGVDAEFAGGLVNELVFRLLVQQFALFSDKQNQWTNKVLIHM